ncbi:hypothetical protein [Bacillus wiedmannii]|uniref:hypothetical protein n=1 Tax=Bacillus wiedmannii TaxID=1890302 RepID=UPI000BFD813C|nr:hypothetical protein [Bacillus wiedmannii]PHA62848.1 hypothetical protein COE75_16545 [Bacillus wiedmannii]
MNSSILTTRNWGRGSLEQREMYDKTREQLAKKNAKKTIVTYPNGEEKEFPSAMKASITLGGSAKLVSQWIKNGGPKTGKWKGYSARLAETN